MNNAERLSFSLAISRCSCNATGRTVQVRRLCLLCQYRSFNELYDL